MASTQNSDLRAASAVLNGLKIAVTGVAALAVLVLLFVGWREAFADQDTVGAAIGQGALASVVALVGVGLVWAVAMLPLWLLSGFARR